MRKALGNALEQHPCTTICYSSSLIHLSTFSHPEQGGGVWKGQSGSYSSDRILALLGVRSPPALPWNKKATACLDPQYQMMGRHFSNTLQGYDSSFKALIRSQNPTHAPPSRLTRLNAWHFAVHFTTGFNHRRITL